LYETSNPIGHPRISPGGDGIAFVETIGAFESTAVNVLDLAGKKRTLSKGWRFVTGLAWSNNNEIWFTGFKSGKILSLYAVDKNGKERPVERMAGNFSLRDISSDGRVLITRDQNRWAMVARVPGVTNEKDFSLFDITAVRDISADGKLLLFHEHGHGASTADGIYVRNTTEQASVKLGEGIPIALSPDEKWVLALTQSNSPRLVVIPTGAGMPVTLERDDIEVYEDYFHWFPDSKHILIDGTDSHHNRRSYIQEIAGKPVPLTPVGTTAALISPDGKRLLLVRNGAVWLRFVEGNELQPVRGITSEDEPIQWSSDGRSILVWDPEPAADRKSVV